MSPTRLYQSTAKAIPYQELARITPTLLAPLAALAALMACFRFVAADGLLSHWQVWLALAIGIQWMAIRLDRRLKQ